MKIHFRMECNFVLHIAIWFIFHAFLLKTFHCQGYYDNVALNKPCRISSMHNETLNKPEKAVNGDTGGVYTPDGNCMHTKGELYNWWEVDLGQTCPVHSITIWARDGRFVERMSRCRIYVDGQECYSFGKVVWSAPRQIKINCTQGVLNGSVVRVEKNSTAEQTEKAINFCEFQVSSCAAGYWGLNCDKVCTGQCRNNDACNPVTGFCNSCQQPGWDPAEGCLKKCPNGTYGQDCARNCSENCADQCDPETGRCTCKAGWKTPSCTEECANGTFGSGCTQTCSVNCVDTCDRTTGNCTCKPGWMLPVCTEKCEEGTWGENCSETCGRCYGGVTCNHVDGSCTQCQGPFMPPLCRNCMGEFFGEYCDTPCSPHCNGSCDGLTGHCTCKPGWKSPNCTQECDDGFYGQDCVEPCHMNCDGVCDKVTGNCTCKPGWQFPNCDQLCPLNTYGTNCTGRCGSCFANAHCDRATGFCQSCQDDFVMPYCTDVDCPNGYFGRICASRCGNCTEDTCHPVTGHCECKPGWKPPLCLEVCDPFTHGVNCSETCGRCAGNSVSCDPHTGYCQACWGNFAMPVCKECTPGYWGTSCDKVCGHCGGAGECERGTGNCLHYCQPGWTYRPRCDHKCPEGTYGDNCSMTCGNCRNDAPCRYDNGFCEECADGFDGFLCQRPSSGTDGNIGTIVGSVVGVGIIIIIAVVAAAWWVRRRRSTPGETPSDAYSLPNKPRKHADPATITERSASASTAIPAETNALSADVTFRIKFDKYGQRVEDTKGDKSFPEMEYLY